MSIDAPAPPAPADTAPPPPAPAPAPVAAAPGPRDDELLARYRPVFARIADGAVGRERDRVLPHEQVGWLRDAGFTAVSVPAEFGGQGASPTQLFRLLIELAEADSNIPQLLRAHFALIEQLRTAAAADTPRALLRRAGSGTIFGNASHERTSARVGELSTTGVRNPDGTWTLSGRKYYSTGSLFADEVFVPATTAEGLRTFVVPATAPGVDLVDDWDGFGQRLTGSGTTILTDVLLPAGAVLEADQNERTHLSAFVELVLLAVLAGIARAAARDAADFVRARTRVYSHGSAPTAAGDPLIQQVVGRISAAAFAAEATVLTAAAEVERAHHAIVAGSGSGSGSGSDSDASDPGAVIEGAELAAVRAQLAVIDLVLPATTLLFEVGGASATSVGRQLDRHWRNARTVSSHNPAVYQARLVGDHLVNGAPLQYFWATG
ncbi:acyl-CoA dehydrogenase family protein, partial [Frankia sp. EI5c]|uniref:acyl-CoA dehydrogenase family protein n=1 Tax=Frankia sp. EI5c TaxID=683316 RepID=UPI0037C17B05